MTDEEERKLKAAWDVLRGNLQRQGGGGKYGVRYNDKPIDLTYRYGFLVDYYGRRQPL